MDFEIKLQKLLEAYDDPSNNGAGHHNVIYAQRQIRDLVVEVVKGERLTNPDKIRGCEKHFPNYTEYCNSCFNLKEYWRGYHVALDDVLKRLDPEALPSNNDLGGDTGTLPTEANGEK